MSFQAYLDNIQAKTGKSPDDFATRALDWLKEDFDLGRGHGMASVKHLKEGD